MPFFYALLLSILLSVSTFLQADNALNTKSVRFATEANYYPFEYLSTKGELKGFDIEIAKAICKEVELDCSFQNQRFDGLLLSLKFGRFDAVIAALDITVDRLENVDFSNSYYKVDPVFLSLQDGQGTFVLKNKFVAVQATSSNQNYLTKYQSQDNFIIPYPTLTEAFRDFKEAKIDAVFADRIAILNFLNKTKNNNAYRISEISGPLFKSFSGGYGIAIKKGNIALQEKLNKGLIKIQDNGIYKKIFEYYFKDENQRQIEK